MRLLFIRHGDPNYELDCLTETGVLEAQALAARAKEWLHPDHIYISPLGRAQQTASYTLRTLGMEGKTMEWLREFPAKLDLNHASPELQRGYEERRAEDGSHLCRIVWDSYPGYFTEHPELIDRNGWRESEIATCSDMVDVYDRVTAGIDELLAEHGYVREGMHYAVKEPNRKTLAFFCHYGITSALLSHLMNVSPFVLMQSACTLTTSVTEVMTEERQKGIASFRAIRIGDLSHLTAAGLQPSFSARFCETYDDFSERH